jgi:hypothetical protein
LCGRPPVVMRHPSARVALRSFGQRADKVKTLPANSALSPPTERYMRVNPRLWRTQLDCWSARQCSLVGETWGRRQMPSPQTVDSKGENWLRGPQPTVFGVLLVSRVAPGGSIPLRNACGQARATNDRRESQAFATEHDVPLGADYLAQLEDSRAGRARPDRVTQTGSSSTAS